MIFFTVTRLLEPVQLTCDLMMHIWALTFNFVFGYIVTYLSAYMGHPSMFHAHVKLLSHTKYTVLYVAHSPATAALSIIT